MRKSSVGWALGQGLCGIEEPVLKKVPEVSKEQNKVGSEIANECLYRPCSGVKHIDSPKITFNTWKEGLLIL
jgi:hypothetical protein